MFIWSFLLLSLGLFALLQFFFIPAAERNPSRVDSKKIFVRSALLSLLGYFRAILFTISLTTLLILLILGLLQFVHGTTVSQLSLAISFAQQVRKLILGFGQTWGVVVIFLLLFIFGIHSYRSGKRRMEKVLEELYKLEFERVIKELGEDKWEQLPPTEEMLGLNERIRLVDEVIRQVNQSGASEAEKAAAKKEAKEAIGKLKEHIFILDCDRRIKEPDPDKIKLPVPTTWSGKLATFFISRGLLTSLNRSSRTLYFASLVLVVPSMLGIYSGSTALQIDSKIDNLNELRIEVSHNEWKKKVDEELKNNQETELSDKQKQTLRNVARAFQSSVTDTSSWSKSSSYKTRSNLIREEIIERATAERPTNAAEARSFWSPVETLESADRAAVKDYKVGLDEKSAKKSVEKIIYEDLEYHVKKDPSLMDLFTDFQEPAKPRQIVETLAGQVVADFTGQFNTELGNILRGLDVNLDRVNLSWKLEQSRKTFFAGLKERKNVNDLLKRVNADMADLQPVLRSVFDKISFEKINNNFAATPPAIIETPDPNLKQARAETEKLVEILAVGKKGVNGTIVTEDLATFSDYFPSEPGAERKTERGVLIAQINKGKGGGGPDGPGSGSGIDPDGTPSGGPKPPKGSGPNSPAGITEYEQTNYDRAHDFSSLLGSQHVGGIVIGRPAEGVSPKLDFSKFYWQEEGDRLRFVLVGSDGRVINSIPFRKSLIYYALLYASDGRPLTVTIISSKPLFDHKVFLHPSLEDTPLGVRLINLDQFVFQFTDENPAAQASLKEAREYLEGLKLLYQFAWSKRMLAIINKTISRGGGNNDLYRIKKEMEDFSAVIYKDQKTRSFLENMLKSPQKLGDPNYSPFKVKKEYFDQELVEEMISAGGETDLERFGESIQTRFTNRLSYIDKDQLENWLAPYPDFELFSGVRESAFKLVPDDILLQEGDNKIPFDFVLQIAFTTPPYFLPKGKSQVSYSDKEPWGFPGLKTIIQDRVFEWTTTDQKRSIIVNDAKEFIMLQRFFRMAFQEHLGENFPVERFLDLFKSLSPTQSKYFTHTLRWDVDPESSNYLDKALQDGEEGKNFRRAIFYGMHIYDQDLIDNVNGKGKEIINQLKKIRESLGIPKEEAQKRKEQNSALPNLN